MFTNDAYLDSEPADLLKKKLWCGSCPWRFLLSFFRKIHAEKPVQVAGFAAKMKLFFFLIFWAFFIYLFIVL
jgi:hypothetical protein